MRSQRLAPLVLRLSGPLNFARAGTGVLSLDCLQMSVVRLAGPGLVHQNAISFDYLECAIQRLVASNTASTLAVSGLSLISQLPVNNALVRARRAVTPTNTNSRSNASTQRAPS